VLIGRRNTDVLLANNLIYGSSHDGVVFSGTQSGPTYLVGNTLFGNRFNGVYIPAGHEVHLVNNVIHSNGAQSGTTGGRYGVQVLTTVPQTVQLIGNLICGNRLGEIAGAALDAQDSANLTPTGAEGAGVGAAAGCELRANTFSNAFGADLLLGTEDDGFALRIGSAGVDSGVDPRTVGLPSALDGSFLLDYDGRTRPLDEDGDGTAVFTRGAAEAVGPAEDPTLVPNTLYVNGSDATCAGQTPCFSTIQAAIDAVTQKDTIRIQPGTYVEQLEIADLNNSGTETATDRITIEADPQATPGSVVLQGAVTGCTTGWAVRFTRSRYVTLRGLTITGAGAEAIRLRSGVNSNHSIALLRNRIYGNATSGDCHGGIRVGASDPNDDSTLNNPNTVIGNNLIYANGRSGLFFDQSAGGPHVVVGNVILRSGWNGVQAPRGHSLLLANNIIYGNGTQAATSAGRFGVNRGGGTPADPEGITLLNNAICANTDGELNAAARILDAGDAGNLTPTGAEGTGIAASASCSQLAALFAHAAGADGTLGTADDDFSLAASSPAIDSGTDVRLLGLPAVFAPDMIADYVQELARPADGNGDGTTAFDMGAVELGAVPPPLQPPTLDITAPADGVRVSASPIEVTGHVTFSDDVEVNGVAAEVTGGTFHASVPLSEGLNSIVVVASNDLDRAQQVIRVTLETQCAGPGGAPKPDGTACDDGNPCTTGDACQAGFCAAGPPRVCEPSDACHTAGVCDPATGSCSDPVAPDGTVCNDGVSCTDDACVAGSCVGTSNCGDYQRCDTTRGVCDLPCISAADCEGQGFCNGVETCSAEGVCAPGPSPCGTGEVCFADFATCLDAAGDADHDGLSNQDEIQLLGTDPYNPDSDFDGIPDGEEVISGADGFITNPLNADSDGDGFRDELEVALGWNPTDAAESVGPLLVSGRSVVVSDPNPIYALWGRELTLQSSTLVLPGLGVASLSLQGGSQLTVEGLATTDLVVSQSSLTVNVQMNADHDVVLDAAQLDLNGDMYVGQDLRVQNGSQITHDATTTPDSFGLGLLVDGLIRVDATSAIDVSGKGYPAGETVGNLPGSDAENGASHGGLGGRWNPLRPRADVYGDPFEVGFAGGGAAGAGGGFVLLRAGILELEGAVRADAAPDGGGSGGALALSIGELRGAGQLSARGAANPGRGGGGGGRIAIEGDASAFAGTISAAGGGVQPGGPGTPGGAGTIYRHAAEQPTGDLLVDNSGQAAPPGSTPLRSIGKGVSAQLQPYRLFDPQRSFPVPDPATGSIGLSGLKLRPRASSPQSFTIIGNTEHEIFTNDDMTTVAQSGDTYGGVRIFDTLTVTGGARVFSVDPCEVTGTLNAAPGTLICAGQDTDGEGLDDADEALIYGTDPANPDSDGDGFSDGAEVTAGTNPLDPSTQNHAPGVPALSGVLVGLHAVQGRLSVCTDDGLPTASCSQRVRVVAAGGSCDDAPLGSGEAQLVAGYWSITGLDSATDYRLYARSSDGALTTCSAPYPIRSELNPPTFDPPASPTVQNPISLSGQAQPDELIELFVNGQSETTVLADAHGAFQFFVIPLLDGANQLVVTAHSADGSTRSSPATEIDYANTLPRALTNPVINTPTVFTRGAADEYIVTGDLTVATGGRLILQSGVKLRFQPGRSLSVSGMLEVRGTESAPVAFAAIDPTALGYWSGIQISGTQSVLRHALVQHAAAGINLQGGASIRVEDSHVQDFDTGLSVPPGASATVLRTGFDNFARGRSGIGLDVSGSAQIQDSAFVHMWTALFMHGSGSYEITGTTFQDSDVGLALTGGSPTILDSQFESNGVGISLAPDASSHPAVHRTRFENQTVAAVHMQVSPSPFYVADFENCWWGSADPVQIAAQIFDHAEFPAAGTVDYVPFQGSAGGALVGDGTVLVGSVLTNTALEARSYTLGGPLLVAPNVTLTVPAGAELRAVRAAGLEVAGTLVVSGSAASPAVFTSALPSPTPGSWAGISLLAGSAANLISHARLDYATTGVLVRSVASILDSEIHLVNSYGVYFDTGADGELRRTSLDNSAITRSLATGVQLNHAAPSVVLEANTILKMGTGITVNGSSGTAAPNANPTISQNHLQGNDTGILVTMAAPPLLDNEIANSTTYGIRLSASSSPLVRGNRLTGNAAGVQIDASSPPAAPVFTGNDFSNPINLAASGSGFASNSQVISAERNWWGSRDVSAIANSILDHSEFENAPLVDYVPFLDAPGGTPIGEGTVLIGSQTGSQSLTPGVPYVIGGAVSVPPGASLTVPAGAEVRFAKGGQLRIAGALVIDGTADQPVLLHPDSATPARGEWQGILVQPGASGAIHHAQIEYARIGVQVQGATFDVADSVITKPFNSGRAISYESGASGSVLRNRIDFDQPNLTGLYLTAPASGVLIEANQFLGVGTSNTAVRVQTGSPTIRANQIPCANAGTGIWLQGQSSPLIDGGNSITHCSYGVYVEAQNLTPLPVVNGNEISQSITYNMVLTGYPASAAALVINAENNSWGLTQVAQIAAKLSQGGTQPQIDFDPFVGGSGLAIGGTLGASRVLDDTTQPYQVISDLIVPAGLTLTVRPGVSLQFAGSSRLHVDGTLLVQGTALAPALFDRLPGATTNWGGIDIGATSTNSRIEYASIAHADAGITVTSSSTDVLTSTIEACRIGLHFTAGAGGLVSGNLIRNDTFSGITLESSSPSIQGNTLRGNATGLELKGGSAPALNAGNHFDANPVAISADGAFGAPPFPQPVIHGNDFTANPINLRMLNFANGQVVSYDLRGNYFGTTDASAIRSSFVLATGSQPVPVDFSNYLDRSATDPATLPVPGSEQVVNYLIGRVSRSTNVIRPGRGETVSISVVLAAPATLSLRFYPERSQPTGTPVRTLSSPGPVSGTYAFVWDGKTESGAYVAEDAYRYVVEAASGGLTSTHDPDLRGTGSAENLSLRTVAFNPFRNESLKVQFITKMVVGLTTLPELLPARYSLTIRQGTSSNVMTIFDQKPIDGGELLVWNGRDPNGVILTGLQQWWVPIPVLLRPNAVIVSGLAPKVSGRTPAAPTVEVKADPYLIYTSYNQIAKIAYCLDQDARVTMKLLHPGFYDPSNPDGVIYTFVNNEIRTATDCAAGAAPHEETFIGRLDPTGRESVVREDGVHTFTIEATSLIDGTSKTLYRGVLQLRQ
jgi:parallel beta-helix repeat protein